MTNQEKLDNEFFDFIKTASPDEISELLKAIKIIRAVPVEHLAQIIPLRESGMTIDQIAEMWGVAL